MNEKIQKLLNDSNDFSDELFAKEALNYLEIEFRKLCLVLLNEVISANIILKSMYAEIAGLQRPSWGCWNGFLQGILKERRSILNTGTLQQRDAINKSSELAWASIRLEEPEEVNDHSFREKWNTINGQSFNNTKKHSIKARELLAIPIMIRNRVAHDNLQDLDWWANVRYILSFIIKWYTKSGIEERFRALLPGEPWLIDSEGDLWCYNGISDKGELSSAFYVSLSGKSKVDQNRAGAVMSAFKKVLGEEDLQEANFKKLLNKLAPEDLKGFLLGGYIVGEKSGEGGFAEVFRGTQLSTGRRVALKILKLGLSEMDRARFLQEAEYLSRFDHPNIAKIYEQNEQPWRKSQLYDLNQEKWFLEFKKNHGHILTYIVMEWIEGNTLDDLYFEMTEGQRNCEEREIAAWFLEASEALEAIHNANLIHRDISPKNIMITENGTIKLMDFGISRSQFEERTLVTSHGKMLGSEPYMSPEQLDYERATAELGPRSDIYSLGSTFYELFTSTRLYHHNNDVVSIATASEMKRHGARPEAPNRVSRNISWEISTILMGCLEIEQADRYVSAEKVKNDIKNYLNDIPIEYRRPNFLRRFQLAYKRNRLVLNVSAVFITLIIILTTFYINALASANTSLKMQILETQKQSNLAKENEGIANIQRDIANDREAKAKASAQEAIRQQQEAEKQAGIAKNNELLAKKNADKANEQTKIARQERDQAWLNESINLAKSSKERFLEGDRAGALRLALEGLPKNKVEPERPYSEEADRALLEALYSDGKEWAVYKRKSDTEEFSSDGQRVLTTYQGDEQKKAYLWDVFSGEELLSWDNVYSAQFSPNGKEILIVRWEEDGDSYNDLTRIVQVESGKEIINLDQDYDPFVHIAKYDSTGTRILTAGGDGMVNIWDAKNGNKLLTLKHYSGKKFKTAEFSSDSKKVVTVSEDGLVIVWNADSGQELNEFNLINNISDRFIGSNTKPSYQIYSPDFIIVNNNKMIVFNLNQNTAYALDINDGKLMFNLESRHDIRTLDFDSTSKKILTSSLNGPPCIWDAENGKSLREFSNIKPGIATLSPDGTKILTTDGYSETLQIMDAETGLSLMQLKGHTKAVTSAKFNFDGSKVITASEDGTTRLWDIDQFKNMNKLEIPSGFTSCQYICAGKRILTTSNDGVAEIWDAESFEKVAQIDYGKDNDVIFNDGHKIVTKSKDWTICVWDVESGHEISKAQIENGLDTILGVSVEARRLVTRDKVNDCVANIWDLENGKKLSELRGHRFGIITAEFSPDGRNVVTGSYDDTARVWDVETGRQIQKIEHRDDVNSVQYSQDGTLILTNEGIKVRFWDAKTGESLEEKTNKYNIRGSYTLFGDSKIISISGEMTVHIWDLKTDKELLPQDLQEGEGGVVGLSPDGKEIIISGSIIYSLEKDKELARSEGLIIFCPNGNKVLMSSDEGEKIIVVDLDVNNNIQSALQLLEGENRSRNYNRY